MNLNCHYMSTADNSQNTSGFSLLPELNPAITNYSGPYPLGELQVARTSLLQFLNGRFSLELRRKLGLMPDGRRFVNASKNHRTSKLSSFDSDWNTSKFELNKSVHEETTQFSKLPVHTQETAAVNSGTNNEPPLTQRPDTTFEREHLSHGMLTPQQEPKFVKRDMNLQYLFSPRSNTEPVDQSLPASDDILNTKFLPRRFKLKYDDNPFDSHMNVVHVDNSRTVGIFCYKCDVCDFISHVRYKGEDKEILSHLQSTSHFSASYCLVKGQTMIPSSVVDPVLVHLPFTRKVERTVSSLFVMCPYCSMVFKNSYFCAFHIRDSHKMPSSKEYGVTSVIKMQTVPLSNALVCSECGEIETSVSKLNNHWKKNSHYPFPSPKKNEKLIFFCPYCMKMLYCIFNMKEHVRECGGHKEKFAVQIVYLKLPPVKKTLLSYPSNMSAEMEMERDIHVVKCFKSAEKDSITRPAKRRLRKNLKGMTNMLNGHQ